MAHCGKCLRSLAENQSSLGCPCRIKDGIRISETSKAAWDRRAALEGEQQ